MRGCQLSAQAHNAVLAVQALALEAAGLLSVAAALAATVTISTPACH